MQPAYDVLQVASCFKTWPLASCQELATHATPAAGALCAGGYDLVNLAKEQLGVVDLRTA